MRDDDDDDDDIGVGAGVFGIGGGVELPTGGNLFSDRGWWPCWWRLRPFYLVAVAAASFVVVFVVVVARPLSMVVCVKGCYATVVMFDD